MRAYARSSAALVAAFIIAQAVVVSGAECPPEIAQLNPGKAGLWATTVRNATPIQLNRNSVTTLAADGFSQFIYYGRPLKPQPDVEGALTVRIGRAKLTADEASLKDIHLRRPFYFWKCGLIELFPLFTVGRDEPLTSYLSHHTTTTDASSQLSAFHFKYRSADDDCIRTDDGKERLPRAARRTGFLVNTDSSPSNESDDEPPLLIGLANLNTITTQSGDGKAYATGTTATPSSESPAFKTLSQRFNLQRREFEKYAHFEVQVMTYPLSNRLCAVFDVKERQAGKQVTIEITDLDGEKGTRRDGRWSVRWQ